jgi:hypothetical protein
MIGPSRPVRSMKQYLGSDSGKGCQFASSDVEKSLTGMSLEQRQWQSDHDVLPFRENKENRTKKSDGNVTGATAVAERL